MDIHEFEKKLFEFYNEDRMDEATHFLRENEKLAEKYNRAVGKPGGIEEIEDGAEAIGRLDDWAIEEMGFSSEDLS